MITYNGKPFETKALMQKVPFLRKGKPKAIILGYSKLNDNMKLK